MNREPMSGESNLGETTPEKAGGEVRLILPRNSTVDPDKRLYWKTYDSYNTAEETVFGYERSDGSRDPSLSYDYSDRFDGWNYEKSGEAKRKARASGVQEGSQRYYEKYLSEFYGKPVELAHIIIGVNKADGQTYYIFGIRKDKEEAKNENALKQEEA